MSAGLTIYTTSLCGPCRRLKSQLTQASIPFDEVNIENDDDAAAWVKSVNAGHQTVPTVRFADDSCMTNPSAAQVADKVASFTKIPDDE